MAEAPPSLGLALVESHHPWELFAELTHIAVNYIPFPRGSIAVSRCFPRAAEQNLFKSIFILNFNIFHTALLAGSKGF